MNVPMINEATAVVFGSGYFDSLYNAAGATLDHSGNATFVRLENKGTINIRSKSFGLDLVSFLFLADRFAPLL